MSRLSTTLSRHSIVVCAILLIAGVATTGRIPSAYHAAALCLPFVAAVVKWPRFWFVLFLPAGVALPLVDAPSPDPEIARALGKRVVVKGQLYENSVKRPSSVKIPIKVESVTSGGKTRKADGKMLIYSGGGSDLAYGDRISAKVRVSAVNSFKNSGSGNYAERLAARGVFFTAYADTVKMEVQARANPVLRAVGQLRRDYGVFIRNSMNPTAAEIVNSLSIGDKGALPDAVKRNFAEIGIGHLLAISGLHVGVAAVFFYMAAKWLLKRSKYLMLMLIVPRAAAMATIPAVIVYALLAGLSNSAARAAVMASVYLFALIIGRKNDRLNSLAAAAIIILIASPGALFEASFILSFSAVLGILLALNRFGGEEDKQTESNMIGKSGRALFAILLTTAAATAATLPFVINMFGFVPVMTFPANLAAMPLVLAMVPMCIVSVAVFAASGTVPEFMLDTLAVFATALTGTADILASWGPEVTVPSLSGWTFAAFYLCAGAVVTARKTKGVIAAAALAVPLFASAWHDLRPAHGENTRAVFFDAGRKKVSLFIFPDGKTVLLKGGFSKRARSDFIERAVIAPALRANRVTEIDTLILLSNDRGHLNGAAALIDDGYVENLWINGPKLNNRLWKSVEKHGVKLKKIHRSPTARQEVGLARVEFLKLHEKLGIADSYAPYPVAVKISYGDMSFLFIESIHNTRRAGVEKIYGNDLKSDVVFLPDINSKNRSAVLAAARATRAEIVVCARCSDELKREEVAAQVYETDKEGMISVFTDRSGIVKTEVFSPREQVSAGH